MASVDLTQTDAAAPREHTSAGTMGHHRAVPAEERWAVPRWWVVAGSAVLLAHLAVLVVLVAHEYNRFNVSLDFGVFHQAWFEIAHGNLDPQTTTQGIAFWQDHGEFVMWPLALLYWVFPNDGFTLLLVQCTALVAAEAVAVVWVVSLARIRGVRRALAAVCAGAGLILFLVDPWSYRVVVQDFHFETLAACLTLGAGFALWSGRRRTAWVLAVLCLLTGDVGATYVAALGVAFALTTKRCRRDGIAIAVVGVAWVALLALLGANKGSPISGYAYLAGHQVSSGIGGVLAIAKGAITHPGRPVHMLRSYRPQILDDLTPTGFVGLFNPWLFGPLLAVLAANGLNANPAFIDPGFQDIPIYLFGVAATALNAVIVLSWRRVRAGIVAAALVVAVLGAVAFALDEVSQGFIVPFHVDAPTAAQIAQIRKATPPDAEVISTFGVVGRFAGRRYAYVISPLGSRFPVHASTVVFVFAPTAGTQPLPLQEIADMRQFVAEGLHATPIVSGPDAWGYVWHPSPGVGQVVLPQ
ncbi:MAG TPA: DUF2079 domain-containing protein [Acidimicrobiales bacterium]|nr:DUF2079 domain-containing protein [Acidimicrobiales bacterium]